MHNRFFLALLSLISFGGVGCLTAHAAGPVWSIAGAHNTVYLAGSIHLLKQAGSTLPRQFERAYADAEVLVMEIDMDDLDPARTAAWMLENGMFKNGMTLRKTLGEERYQRFAAEAASLGMPAEGLQQFEPWVVGLQLVEMQYQKMGFDTQLGVERQLEQRARADGKEIRGLETVAEQLGLFDALSYEEQARFLDMVVTEAEETEDQLDDVIAAWRSGNTRRLAKLLGEEFDDAAALYKTIVSERNAKWMPALHKLLADDKDYLVVVGALHLVGDDGVLELARQQGLKPVQLQ